MARARGTQSKKVHVDFAFYAALLDFYRRNRGAIRTHYKDLTKRFLDFNDAQVRPDAFLREPQFEALEIYVFLKEFLDNAPVRRIFEDWYLVRGRFEGRGAVSATAQGELFLDKDRYRAVFERMLQDRAYPNYIFALTMGTGKTILMATCIFYEFVLARKWPKDPRFCHNALVFAPDKTVLQSLKEIQELDFRKVVPQEYAKILSDELRFHFLDDAGVSLQTLDGSSFNIIVSNTQKVILKKQHKQKPAADQLFQDRRPLGQTGTVADEAADLYADAPEDEAELTPNQRFEKLARLHQLGIYVDEAHHAFGQQLADDLGSTDKLSATSLRLTIDALAKRLGEKGQKVVACYNYTGTPYVGSIVLPEVVYAYSLKKAIDRGFLKQVKLISYQNSPKTYESVKRAIKEFWEAEKDNRYEELLPKMAFFASTIDELRDELRPAVEKALRELKISDGEDRILVNVGDPKLTTNDEIREFNALDQPKSQKQFILLVNKGREGWNCRSLFAVALFRTPKSRVFVLQATMRCLRSIGPTQSTGRVFLSDANLEILKEELQQNFQISTDEIQRAGTSTPPVYVRVRKDVIIPLLRPHKVFKQEEKPIPAGLDLRLDDIDRDRYRLIRQERDSFDPDAPVQTDDISYEKVRRRFSSYTLVAEIARYLNAPPLRIEEILSESKHGMQAVVDRVNEFNEVLHDWIVPRLCEAMYEIRSEQTFQQHDVRLALPPPSPPGYYLVHAAPEDTLTCDDTRTVAHADRSFHLDTYCFDSSPEQQAFLDALRDGENESVYFTGMLTHGQTEFFVYYIDPESSALRRYYPDFLIKRGDTWLIVEVKGDHLLEDPVVQAKQDAARDLASSDKFKYLMISGTEAKAGLLRARIDAVLDGSAAERPRGVGGDEDPRESGEERGGRHR